MSRASPPVYRLSLFRILALIPQARALRKREGWSRDQIQRHQDRELARLRQFAYAHSPFYQRFHEGLEGRPLHQLPILTKKELMQSWDDIVTERSLHLRDIQRFLERVKGFEPYHNTHYAYATGGTTGIKGVTVYSEKELLLIFALTSRTTRWTGMRFSLRERPRMSIVQSLQPWHVAGGQAFIRLPVVKTLPLDTTEPIPQLVRKLNDFQPHVLGGFAGKSICSRRSKSQGGFGSRRAPYCAPPRPSREKVARRSRKPGLPSHSRRTARPRPQKPRPNARNIEGCIFMKTW